MSDRPPARRISRRIALGAASMAAFGAAIHTEAKPAGIARVALPDLPTGATSDLVKPGAAWATQLWGGTLLARNESDLLVPSLGSFDVSSPDWSVFQLKARVGALFADGTPILADDIRQSLLYARDRCDAAGEGWRFECLDTIEIVDNRSVQISLTEADASFPTTLASYRVPVVSALWIESGARWDSPSQASGGFVRGTVTSSTIECRRSSTFYQIGRPHLAGVQCLAPDAALSSAMQLVTGACDLIIDVPLLDVPTVRENPGFQLAGGPARNLCYLVCNLARPPMDDLRVRSIVSRTLNREEIVQNATAGEAAVAETLFPPDHWAGMSEPLESLTAGDAQSLFRALGYESNLVFRLVVDARDSILVNAGVTIQNQLAYAGCAVQLDLIDPSHLQTQMAEGDWDICLVRSPYWDDPHQLVRPLLVTDGTSNLNRYTNHSIDYQVALARRSRPPQRAVWYQRIEQIVRRELPVIPLFFPFSYDAMTLAIANYPVFGPISARAMLQAVMTPSGTIATP